MQHTITSKQRISGHEWRVEVTLNPTSPAEAAAIAQVERMAATEAQRQLVDDHLALYLIELGDYSIVASERQQDRRFTIRVFI